MSRITKEFEQICIEKKDSTAFIYQAKKGLVKKSFSKLYEDVNSLNAMSRACGEYIRKYHSIDAVWDIIKDDFE